MAMKQDQTRNLPPDPELVALAAVINEKLPPHSGVSFYRIMHPDAQTEIGIIYQCGARRAVVRTPVEPEVDEVVQSVNEWIYNMGTGNRWTTDIREAG